MSKRGFEGLVRPQYLGLGFVWAWIYGAYGTSALFPERTGIGINADSTWIVSSTSVTVALFAFGLVFRGRNMTRATSWHLGAAVAASLGTLLSVIPFASPFVFAVDIVSGIMTGVGTALLILFWCDALSRINIAQAETCICLSSAIPVICALTVPHLQGIPGTLAVAVLPLLSGVLLAFVGHNSKPLAQGERKTASNGTAEYPGKVRGAEAFSAFMRAMAVVALFYLVIGYLSARSSTNDSVQQLVGLDLATFIGSGFGIMLALAFASFSMRIDFTEMFRWLGPLAIAGIALSPWNDPTAEFLSATIMNLSDTALQTVSFICLITLVKRGGSDVYIGTGFCQGAIQLGVLIGNSVCLLSPESPAGSLGASIPAFLLICLVSFALAALPRSENGQGMGPGPARGTATFGSDESGNERIAPSRTFVLAETALHQSILKPKASADDEFHRRCEKLSSTFGLSKRETEVLGYLAKGRSQPYIREELVLSKNTVSSHVKHIYAKLGVHSKQELIDLFESRI